MSQENVELVRRGLESVDAFWAMLDEYVVWDLRDLPVVDLDSVYVGRERLSRLLAITGARGATTASIRRNSWMRDRPLSLSSVNEAVERAAALQSTSD